ncbi:hypothetical protein [Phycicoccus flavus]|uniref:hypothetical protein n=1 Tax=Phycicoccus flavus TaxID=2502783 RepID=UPI000FEBD62C|nr:hypothetical protein [Phycicoccus flavus]NHA67240.1 hypothetical protein [Phycicoccus flavus]
MSADRWRTGPRSEAPALLASLLAALALLGPGLAGTTLVRDLVLVPDPAFTPRLLGLGQETPRGVPSDLVAALLATALGARAASVVLLLGALLLAGWGASRLVGPRQPARCAAAVAALWNPYVAERLALGHWALLLGYAALPWVLAAAVAHLRGEGPARPVVVAVLAGSLGGAVAWLLVVLGLVAALVAVPPHRGRPLPAGWWAPVAAAVAGALPWLVPSLVRPVPPRSDALGFEVFGPRADLPAGPLLSVLTGGGVWNAAVVPAGRDTALGAALALVVLAVAAAGWLLGGRPGPAERVVLVAGAGALALVAVGTFLGPALATLPGAGLLRDGTRSLGPWVLVLAVGLGRAVRGGLRHGLPVAAATLVALLPVAALPGAAWGVGGRLGPTDLPAAAADVAARVAASPSPRTVLVLPFTPVRAYPWNDGRVSLTPWSRLLDARVVGGSDLRVARPDGTVVVPGEDPLAAALGRALAAPDPRAALEAAGVGWVLVDDGPPPAWLPAPVDLGDGVVLARLDPAPGAGPGRDDPPAGPVLAADAVALVLAVFALAGAGSAGLRRRRPTMQ